MALDYELNRDTRIAMRQDEPAVRAAIAKIANEVVGRPDAAVMGAFKCGGGVRVNNREISIYRTSIKDDFKKSAEPTIEEKAVFQALHHVAEIIRTSGMGEIRKRYGRCVIGNPLDALTFKI